jgi:hypothetical protein
MAQIRVLKIDTDGVPREHSLSDDITFTSFTVDAGGPVLSGTGLDMNNTDVSDIQDLVMNNPATGTINQTAGNLIIDNIMAKERENLMTTAGGISFPAISDVAGEVDALRIPSLAGVPTATPTTGGSGHLVFDTTNNDLYIWDGAAWDNLNIVEVANNVDDSYIAEVAVAARDLVYISSADNVSPAIASANASSQGIGFATAAALATAAVNVRKFGRLDGFSGLTAGARYYLSGSVAGAITATVPVGAGNTILQAGYAKNATTLDIMIENLGRRA